MILVTIHTPNGPHTAEPQATFADAVELLLGLMSPEELDFFAAHRFRGIVAGIRNARPPRECELGDVVA